MKDLIDKATHAVFMVSNQKMEMTVIGYILIANGIAMYLDKGESEYKPLECNLRFPDIFVYPL